ncbi:hypothetical protein HMPREF1547_02666 [Blautia sp. KLE 1732]|nr:hypothetical protein HMPREF1547_02666 [Blautia sp. KLE 1732]
MYNRKTQTTEALANSIVCVNECIISAFFPESQAARLFVK